MLAVYRLASLWIQISFLRYISSHSGADMSPITAVTLLVFLLIHEGSSMGEQGVIQRCICITKEKKPIGRYIGAVEVQPASSFCMETQIIATLKRNGQKICLDPDAPWVKVIMKRLLRQTP